MTTPNISSTAPRRPPARLTDFVYILSPSYSGSTLLTLLLAAHPDIATIGELKATALGDLDEYDCSCGTRIRRCPFWGQVIERLAKEGVALDLENPGTHFRGAPGTLADRVLRARVRRRSFETLRNVALAYVPGARPVLQAVLERNRLIAETVAELQQCAVFLDGSKDPVRLRYLFDTGWWNVKVIYLVRDGRGTANSFIKHEGLSMERAAFEWKRRHQECGCALARLRRDAWMRMRYEDLCRDPNRVMADVFAFLGLDPHRAERDLRAVEHHVLGNAMRLASNSEIALDEKWREKLTREQLRTFERISGRLNREFGYGDVETA